MRGYMTPRHGVWSSQGIVQAVFSDKGLLDMQAFNRIPRMGIAGDRACYFGDLRKEGPYDYHVTWLIEGVGAPNAPFYLHMGIGLNSL